MILSYSAIVCLPISQSECQIISLRVVRRSSVSERDVEKNTADSECTVAVRSEHNEGRSPPPAVLLLLLLPHLDTGSHYRIHSPRQFECHHYDDDVNFRPGGRVRGYRADVFSTP